MNKLIHSEVRKLATTRWFKITMAITVMMAPAFTLLGVFADTRAPGVGDDEFVHGVLSVSVVSSLVLLGVGIAAMAGEFRHGTSVPTFLISPRRRDVVVAKLVTITGLGAVVGATSFGLAVAVAVPALGHKGIHHLAGDTPQMWIGATVATALFGAVGVALGSITRNMVIAIVGAIGWTYVIEGLILTQALPSASKWLPAGANMSITHTGDSTDLLQPWVALIVLVTWVVAFSAVATRSILRRDV
jgi:ABC-type transport system involved in multi-copper enzyme maturation permease subunit